MVLNSSKTSAGRPVSEGKAPASGRRAPSSCASHAVRSVRVELGVGPLRLAQGIDERGDRQVMGVGMLPDVHGRQVQAHGAHRADEVGEPSLGHQPPVVLEERTAEHFEVLEECLRTEVVGSGFVATERAGGDACPRASQLGPDARDLEPVGLLGVDAPEARIDLGEAIEVSRQRSSSSLGRAGDARRHAQLFDELGEHPLDATDALLVLQREHVHGDPGCDVGVAVAVAAGPGAEPQWRGRGGKVDAEAGEHGGQVGQHLRDGGARCVDEVEDGVAGLVDRLGSLPPQLVGEPEQVDDLRQPPIRAGFEIGPWRQGGFGGLGIEELGDSPELGERRAPSRLRRVRGEDRPDLETRGGDGELVVTDLPVLQQAGGAVEPPTDGGTSAAQLPAPMDLLDDVGEVEIGVEGPHQPRRHGFVDVARAGRRRATGRSA